MFKLPDRLSVVFMQEETLDEITEQPKFVWVAQALEMDFVTQGDTLDEAAEGLYRHILAHIQIGNVGNTRFNIGKAPGYYWGLYESGEVFNSNFDNFNARIFKDYSTIQTEFTFKIVA